MKNIILLLFILTLLGCDSNDPELINIDATTGVVTFDGLNPRELWEFRDDPNVTYSISFENLPQTLSQQDVLEATQSAFEIWSQEIFYFRNGENSFNFTYSPFDINSDIIIQFVEIQILLDNESLLPFPLCSADPECDSEKILANAFFPKSNRYPHLQRNPDLLNENAQDVISQGLIKENYWKYISIFLNDEIIWDYQSNGNISNSSYDLKTAILHEIGHRLGLDHDLINETALMYRTYNKGETKHEITTFDKSIIASAYPNVNTGKFPFFDGIEINDFFITPVASNDENVSLRLQGALMPFDMNVVFSQNIIGDEIVDNITWNDAERSYLFDLESINSFRNVNLSIFQDKERFDEVLKLVDLTFDVPKKEGIVAFDESTQKIVELYFDGNSNLDHGAVSLSSLIVNNGVFNPNSFSYYLKDPNTNKLYKYSLVTDELIDFNLPNDILFMNYTNENYFIGIDNNNSTFVRIDPDTGNTNVLTNLPSNNVNLFFGSAVNPNDQTFTYNTGSEIITINYFTGNIINQLSYATPTAGLSYSIIDDKYYCVQNDQLKSIDVTTGVTTDLSINTSVTGIEQIPFIHPVNNKYYYVSNGVLYGVSISGNENTTSVDVQNYKYIQPIY